MKLSIIINNTSFNHEELFNVLKLFNYNPYVLEFEKLNVLYKCSYKKCVNLIFFIITEMSENNEIIYKNKLYRITKYLCDISKLNIKTFIFFDYHSINIRKKFKTNFTGLSILFVAKINENNSKLINIVIKYLKQIEISDELIENVFKELKQNTNYEYN